jgi:endonuclease/exonuclease/phosphatase family metal-dependent hydrolase
VEQGGCRLKAHFGICDTKGLPSRANSRTLSLAALILLPGMLLAGGPGACGPDSPVRVGTWNVHGLRGGRAMADALRSVVSRVDLLALQETHASESVTALLGTRPGEWYETRFSSNAILSRWPIESAGAVEVNSKHPRHLPWADVRHPEGCLLRIYSVHLSYKVGWNPLIGKQRAAESRTLIQHAAGFAGSVVFAGDLNSMGWLVAGHGSEPSLKLFREAGFVNTGEDSPGGTHQFLGKLDWILVRGPHHRESLRGSYDGSDHRWLTASLGPGTQPQPQTVLAALHPNLEPGGWAVLSVLALLTWGAVRACAAAWTRLARPAGTPESVEVSRPALPLPIATATTD